MRIKTPKTNESNQYFTTFFFIAHVVTSFVFNETALNKVEKNDLAVLTRRQGRGKKSQSTSSDSIRGSGKPSRY